MESQDDLLFGNTQIEDIVEPTSKRRRSRQILHDWTEDEVFQLIEAVEFKPELWKSNDESYKNRNKKEVAWRNIEENVFNGDIDSSEITAKWNNLRVQYKSYRKKTSSSGREPINKWKFFDAMNFISLNQESTTETPAKHVPMVIYPDDFTLSSQSAPYVSQTTSTSVASSSRTQRSKKPPPADSDTDDVVFEGIKLAVDNLKESKNDEFYVFGQFVAAEVRRLPNDSQKQKLKRVIQRAIMDFNEKIEEESELN